MSVSQAQGFPGRFLGWASVALLGGILGRGAGAAPIPVHYAEGTVHGYLSLRSTDGTVLAVGDLIQTLRGSVVTSHMVFHFKDGSLDDETSVFSQRGNFQLISDHHIQKGPFYEHPIDMTIDARKGLVTSRTAGKDGKDDVTTDHMKLPPDIAGSLMIVPIAKNLNARAAETDVPIVVATPKPRLVTLKFTPDGQDAFSLEGVERKAIHYQIKFDLGGAAGLIAPMIGKKPPDVDVWIEGGEVPAFVKEEGPLAADGPVVTIQQTGPMGPGGSGAASKK